MTNITHITESEAPLGTQKRRRLSWRTQPMSPVPPSDITAIATDPHAALMQGHDHEGMAERTRHSHGDSIEKSKIEKMITPYLAQHIPQQYNPLGGGRDGQNAPSATANTKYCYRHRPDLLCRRQADEPSMEQLQDVSTLYDVFNDGY